MGSFMLVLLCVYVKLLPVLKSHVCLYTGVERVVACVHFNLNANTSVNTECAHANNFLALNVLRATVL